MSSQHQFLKPGHKLLLSCWFLRLYVHHVLYVLLKNVAGISRADIK